VRTPSGITAFLLIWALFVAGLLVLVLTTDRFALHVLMQPVHTPILDRSFSTITHLSDGIVPTILALILLYFGTMRSFLMMGLGCSFGALVTQGLKRGPFAHMDRPFMFQDALVDLPWVSGLELNHHFSFPSGHATAAFNMCFALAVLIPGRFRGIGFALLAGLLAYSRVYLSQHFTEDILAGAVVGTITSLLVYVLLYRSSYSTRAWLDRRLRAS
jgi:membrane-associated phospholipid phosphatase